MATGSEDGTVIMRRRDKRRHLSTLAVDLRDPYSLLSLAVRFDESSDDESLLKVPLESASIYDQRSFAKALQNLQKMTAPLRPASGVRRNATEENVITTPGKATGAVTPIIFSGLLATLYDQTTVPGDEPAPSSSELVAYCQSMRQAALARVRIRKQRQRIRRIFTPFLFFVGIFTFCYSTLSKLKQTIIDFDFVDSSNLTAYRFHSAPVWGLLQAPGILEDCTFEACPSFEGLPQDPIYALHADFRFETVPLDRVGSSKRHRGQWTPKNYEKKKFSKRAIVHLPPLQRLGGSVVNSLVRDTLAETRSSQSGLKLLDAGCGIGGTLYALLGSSFQEISYHGIALAGPEIRKATHQLKVHKLARLPSTFTIRFQKKEYDEPFNETYSTMVAIESLSFSHDVNVTLANLASSLQPKGVLVIVDDVVSAWTRSTRIDKLSRATMQRSLLTLTEWRSSIESAGLQLKVIRDISLEMELPEHSAPPTGKFGEFLRTWRHRTAELALRNWPHFGPAEQETTPALRMLQLVQDLVQSAKGSALRHDYHREADLLYYMFVVEKA